MKTVIMGAGAMVREAERLGVSVPYNQMITDLVKAIERRF